MGLYPIVALAAHNMGQVHLIYIVRPALVTLAGVLIFYFLITKFVKDPSKAALVTLWLLLLFFSYGHVYGAIEDKQLAGLVIGRHRYLIVMWGLLGITGVWWIVKKFVKIGNYHQFLNFISLVLVIIPLFKIIWYEAGSAGVGKAASVREAATPSGGQTVAAEKQDLPDIYYIILDAYSRDDFLKKQQHFDNRPFIDQLKSLGFYVASCSQSNYSFTALSLASSLNMNYVEQINPDIVDLNMSWSNFDEYIRHSQVRQELQSMGYQTVSYETGVVWTEIPDADVYYSRDRSLTAVLSDINQPTDFEMLYLRTTALRFVDEIKGFLPVQIARRMKTLEENHYERIQYVLDELDQTPLLESPKFVFLHIVGPHPPFVFTPDGQYQLSGEDPGYANEIAYLNQRMLQAVQKILKESKRPPIIIIQGDHGLDYEERVSILNAYYFPEGAQKALYPEITPVNTFRVVFNQFFGKNFELLPDNSYLSDRDVPYDFVKVKYECKANR